VVVVVRCCVECAVSELFLSLRLEALCFLFFLFSRYAMAMPFVSTHLLYGVLEVSCRKAQTYGLHIFSEREECNGQVTTATWDSGSIGFQDIKGISPCHCNHKHPLTHETSPNMRMKNLLWRYLRKYKRKTVKQRK
jgi:hypothetical protein